MTDDDRYSKTALFHKPLLHLSLIIILGFLAYSNTLHVPYFFDDTFHIQDNQAIHNLANLWPPSGSRWFGYLTFALNYHFGGLDTTGYHIVNLAIHIINAILVYWLVILTFKTPPLNPPLTKGGTGGVAFASNRSATADFIALFSALIFVSHPIQTQAVTYIVQRFTSLATMFYLLSLVMYIKFRQQDKTLNLKPKAWYLCSVISAILAMKTKEIAFTLPIIIVLYEFMFFSDNSQSAQPQAGPPGRKIRNPRLKRFLFLLPFLLTMLIIPLSLINTDKPIGDMIGEFRDASQETDEIPRWSYLFTQFRVIVTYIRLLFLPINQNLDYDYPIYHSFSDPNVFLSFLFLLSVFCIGVYLLYKYRLKNTKEFIINPPSPSPSPARGEGSNKSPSSREEGVSIMYLSSENEDTKRISPPLTPLEIATLTGLTGGDKGEGVVCGFANDRISNYSPFTIHYSLIAFGIFWFFITLSVESSAIPIRDVIFEHRLYLPGIGFFFVISSLPFLLFKKIETGKMNIFIVVVFLMISFALASAAYKRNNLWGNSVIFHEDSVRKSPNKARPHYNLGLAYMSKDLIDPAIEQFETAARLWPYVPHVYNNLGLAYASKGIWDKAFFNYQRAIKLKPDDLDSHFNLGLFYLDTGKIEMARAEFETALKIRPGYYKAEQFLNYTSAIINKSISSQ